MHRCCASDRRLHFPEDRLTTRSGWTCCQQKDCRGHQNKRDGCNTYAEAGGEPSRSAARLGGSLSRLSQGILQQIGCRWGGVLRGECTHQQVVARFALPTGRA